MPTGSRAPTGRIRSRSSRSRPRSRIRELVPVRYGRMAVSPFTFYRGAALPMAADLSTTPSTGFQVQLAGDAHLSNFGLFASPERDLVFDINDFDETHPGPWEWDVKRLAGSLVAGRPGARVRHPSGAPRGPRGGAFLSRADGRLRGHAGDRRLLREGRCRRNRRLCQQARAALPRDDRQVGRPPRRAPRAPEADRGRRDRASPDRRPSADHHPPTRHDASTPGCGPRDVPGHPPGRSTRSFSIDTTSSTARSRSSESAASVSVLTPPSSRAAGSDDPFFLQAKEAEASVLERFLGPSAYRSHGERVVAGQRRLQAASDVMLGWTVGPLGRHLYMRQLQDQKAGAVLEAMTFDDLETWGELVRLGPRPGPRPDRGTGHHRRLPRNR